MADQHKKRCSLLNANQTTMRSHFTPTGMAVNKQTDRQTDKDHGWKLEGHGDVGVRPRRRAERQTPGMKQNHRGTRRPRFWAFIQKKEVTAHAVTRTRLAESRHVTRVRHQRTTAV